MASRADGYLPLNSWRRERLVPAKIKFELTDGVIRQNGCRENALDNLNVPQYWHILVQ